MQNSLFQHTVYSPCLAAVAYYARSLKPKLVIFSGIFTGKGLREKNSSTMSMNMNTTSNCVSPASMKAAYIGYTVTYCILLVGPLTGNSFVGIIVYKTRTMRKTINFFIVNMAMSDLLYSIFAFPWALTELNAGSRLISGIFGQTVCKMISFATVVSIAVFIQSLILIAVDRFGAVVFPLRSPLIGSKLCPFLILATWIFAITTQFPYYFVYKFVEYPEKLACEVRWKEVFDESSYDILQNYIIVLSILELYIPFTLMTILYSIILCKLKIQRVPGVQSVNTENLRAKRQRNVLKMAIAIVLVFAISWLPLNILVFLSIFLWNDKTSPPCGILHYLLVGQIIASANCAINPCICFFFSGNYRQVLKNLLETLFCRIFKVKAKFAIPS